jgi:hypothetical protein
MLLIIKVDLKDIYPYEGTKPSQTSHRTIPFPSFQYSTTPSGVLLDLAFILASCHAPGSCVRYWGPQGVSGGGLGGVPTPFSFSITSVVPMPDGTETQYMCPREFQLFLVFQRFPRFYGFRNMFYVYGFRKYIFGFRNIMSGFRNMCDVSRFREFSGGSPSATGGYVPVVTL